MKKYFVIYFATAFIFSNSICHACPTLKGAYPNCVNSNGDGSAGITIAQSTHVSSEGYWTEYDITVVNDPKTPSMDWKKQILTNGKSYKLPNDPSFNGITDISYTARCHGGNLVIDEEAKVVQMDGTLKQEKSHQLWFKDDGALNVEYDNGDAAQCR